MLDMLGEKCWFFLFFREKRTYIKNTKTHQALNTSTNTNTNSPTNHSINLPNISLSIYINANTNLSIYQTPIPYTYHAYLIHTCKYNQP